MPKTTMPPPGTLALSVTLLACAGTTAAPAGPTSAHSSDARPLPGPTAVAYTRGVPAGRLPGRAPDSAPELSALWSTETAIRVPPVWSGRRMVVASSGGAVMGLAADGSAAWELDLGQHVVGLASDGAGGLLVTTRQGEVVALGDDGRRRWSRSLGATSGASAVLTADGRAYALADGLHALDAQGQLLWQLPRVGGSRAGPAVIGELIVFGTQHGELVAVDRDGAVRWTLHVGAAVDSPPCAGPDGDILVGTDLGQLRSVSASGELRWTTELEGRISAAPSVGPDGRIAVVGGDHTLYYLDRSGKLLWRFVAGGALVAQPTIDAAGAILLAGRDNNLYLIEDSGAARWRTNVGHPIATPVVAAPDGTLHIGTDGGRLLSLRKRNIK